jgi:hypothetical protein
MNSLGQAPSVARPNYRYSLLPTYIHTYINRYIHTIIDTYIHDLTEAPHNEANLFAYIHDRVVPLGSDLEEMAAQHGLQIVEVKNFQEIMQELLQNPLKKNQ